MLPSHPVPPRLDSLRPHNAASGHGRESLRVSALRDAAFGHGILGRRGSRQRTNVPPAMSPPKRTNVPPAEMPNGAPCGRVSGIAIQFLSTSRSPATDCPKGKSGNEELENHHRYEAEFQRPRDGDARTSRPPPPPNRAHAPARGGKRHVGEKLLRRPDVEKNNENHLCEIRQENGDCRPQKFPAEIAESSVSLTRFPSGAPCGRV